MVKRWQGDFVFGLVIFGYMEALRGNTTGSKHWCLAFAMYLRCLGGVESKTSKALFGTVSSEAKDISSPLLPSISIYLTQHLYLSHSVQGNTTRTSITNFVCGSSAR